MVRIAAKCMLVNSTHLEDDANAAVWFRVRDVFAGEVAVKRRSSRFLRPFSGGPFHYSSVLAHYPLSTRPLLAYGDPPVWAILAAMSESINPETAVEQPRHENTKSCEKSFCVKPPAWRLPSFGQGARPIRVHQCSSAVDSCFRLFFGGLCRRQFTTPENCTVSAPKNAFFPNRHLSLNHLQKDRSQVVQFCLAHILDREKTPHFGQETVKF